MLCPYPVKSHRCGPVVPGTPQPEVMEQGEDRDLVFRQGQPEEIVLLQISGHVGELRTSLDGIQASEWWERGRSLLGLYESPY